METVCIVWFTIEFLLRFWSAPYKKIFFQEIQNYIDFFSILPYFISIILSEKYYKINSLNNARRTLQIFRVLRILRVFKLARYSSGLRTLAYTLKSSIKELGSLFTFLLIGMLLFSSLVYFAEKDHPNTKFTSIPAAFW